jgi:hypothetical protein
VGCVLAASRLGIRVLCILARFAAAGSHSTFLFVCR